MQTKAALAMEKRISAGFYNTRSPVCGACGNSSRIRPIQSIFLPPAAVGGKLFALRKLPPGRVLGKKRLECPSGRGLGRGRGGIRRCRPVFRLDQTDLHPPQPPRNPDHQAQQQNQQPHRGGEQDERGGRRNFRHGANLARRKGFEKPQIQSLSAARHRHLQRVN